VSKYKISGVLASGVTGSVRAGVCIHGDQSQLLAIKVSTEEMACREPAFLKFCEGPHITKLLDSFTSASLTCIVMPHYDMTLKQMLLDLPCMFKVRGLRMGMRFGPPVYIYIYICIYSHPIYIYIYICAK